MEYKFQVGKTYKCMDKRMNPLTVIDRSKKKVLLRNDKNEEFTLKIYFEGKNEYVVDDKHSPANLKGLFCYLAESEM